MRVERSIREMAIWAEKRQRYGKIVGLVPTMGALHDGHISLVKLLENRCDLRVASILINPLQFSENEDLKSYPRSEENDIELLEECGCDVVFIPTPEKMFPTGYSTYVLEDQLSKDLCGKYRPTHFRGVTTIVNRLFNLTSCNVAAFGLKDYQQGVVIRRMVENLFLPVKLVFGETVREDSGLAMSSRNAYLNDDQRQAASSIPQSLNWAREQVLNRIELSSTIKNGVEERLTRENDIKVQYIEIVDPLTLVPLDYITTKAQLLIAVHCGSTRLIDNIEIGMESQSNPIRLDK